MNARHVVGLLCLLAALHMGVAHATGPEEGQWRWSLTAGNSMPASATVQKGTTGTTADFGAATGPLAGNGGTVDLDHLRFSDIYGTGLKLGAEASYGESRSLESFLRLSYESEPGRGPQRVGSVTNATLGVSAPVLADFGALRTWQLAAGERYLFRPGASLRPFVDVDLGVAHDNSVDATYSAPDVSLSLGSGRYFKSSTGLLADAGAGLDYGIAPGIDLTFGVQAEYQANATIDSVTLASAGLPELSAGASRWAFPARLGVRYSF
jgi:hypothetical protein